MNQISPFNEKLTLNRSPWRTGAWAVLVTLLALLAGPAIVQAQIGVLSSGSATKAGTSSVYTYTLFSGVSASGASKLVVTVNNYQSSGGSGVDVVAFGSQNLVKAVSCAGNNTQRGIASIWYLDSPTGPGDIVITVSGGKNQGGIVASYLMLSGTSAGVDQTGSTGVSYPNGTTPQTVELTGVAANAIVVAANYCRSATLPSCVSPLITVGSSLSAGSGCSGVSGYQNGVSGTVDSSFNVPTTGSTLNVMSVAAAFAPGGATPTITSSATLTNFVTHSGTPSPAQHFGVTGSGLTSDITNTAPTGFEVSTDGSTYAAQVNFPQSGGNAGGTLYVRLAAATAPGSYSGNVALASDGATEVDISAAGTVLGAATISATATLTSFVTTYGTASPAQSFPVMGTNLTASIACSAPSGFELSTDGSSYAGAVYFPQSTPESGGTASGTLYVRLAAATPVGSYSGNVALSSAPATTVNIGASGTVNAVGSDGAWSLDGSGNWSQAGNWLSSQIADGQGRTAWFTNDITGDHTVTLNTTPRTLGVLDIGAPNGLNKFTLAASGGAALTFSNGVSSAQLNETSASAGDTLDSTLPISLSSSLVVSNASANALTINGTISGGGGLTLAGGALVLGGSNAFTGATTVSGGTLQLAHTNALAASAGLNLTNGATLQLRANTSATFNTPEAVVAQNAAATIDLNNNGSGSSHTLALSNGLGFNSTAGADSTFNITGGNGYVLNAPLTYTRTGGNSSLSLNPTTASVSINSVTFTTVAGSDTLYLDGTSTGNQLTGTPSSDWLYVTKQGTGTWTWGADNSHVLGGCVISAGNLIVTGTLKPYGGAASRNVELNGGVMLYNNAGAVDTGASGTQPYLIFGGGNLDNSSGAPITTSTYNPLQKWNANFTFLGTGAVSLGASRMVTINSSATLTVAGAIADGGHGYGVTKAGTGTLQLTGANTYSGATTISAGTLALGSGGSLANTPSISIAAAATLDGSAAGITLTGSSPQQTLACGSASGTAAINATGQAVILNSGALLSFQAAGGSATTVGKASVTGDLTLNANAVTVNVTGAALAGGTYRLLDCTGTLNNTGTFDTPAITGTPLAGGYTASISVTTGSGGHVDLVVNTGVPPPAAMGITSNGSGDYWIGGSISASFSGQTVHLYISHDLSLGMAGFTDTGVTTTVGGDGSFLFFPPRNPATDGTPSFYLAK